MMIKTRVALFIDAENASAKYVSDYLKRCNELGKLTIARCYGGTAGLKKWEKAMAEHHIFPMQTPPGGEKKNASDFALIIDAVSLLHRDLFDHAVIVSSDVDFTQLAIHIRENGKSVDGFGEEKSKEFLRSAFNWFKVVPEPTTKKASAPKTLPAPTKKSAAIKKTDTELKIDTPLLLQLFHELDKNSPVKVQVFGKILAAKLPANYLKGHRSLTNYLKKSRVFEVTEGVVKQK
jgi:hypothetical protein